MAVDESGHKRVLCRSGFTRERGAARFALDSTDAGSYCLPLPRRPLRAIISPGSCMGHRLSKIYTRTGDDGTTGLGDGSRVDKDSARVEAYGTVDEANSALGVVLACASVPDDVRRCLTELQHDLFELGGELCIPGHAAVQPEFITRLEQELDRFNDDLPPLKEFILPGGGQAAAACHVARATVRRAERRVQHLAKEESVRDEAIGYLNRLSDLLFVIARVLCRAESGQEVLWDRERSGS